MAANSKHAAADRASLPLPIVIVGHVDHGKSTLVGRLLHDTGSVAEEKLSELRAISARRGHEIEWSFLLDSLQVERDQGITLDTTQVWFSTARRRYVIIDAPGHKEFLKNMVTGASRAEAAVLLVDAKQGVSEQTRRHAQLLEMLGLRQVVVAINKMDLVGHAEKRFAEVTKEVTAFLGGLAIEPAAVIPISARHGDNIVRPSEAMPWYRGAMLVTALDALLPRPAPIDEPLRLPVQDVYRQGERRVIVGRIEGGRLRVGDEVVHWPSGRTARIASFETWNRATPQIAAAAGESVAVTLDDDLFVERGGLLSDPRATPPASHAIVVRLFWLGPSPLTVGHRLKLRTGTTEYAVVVESIEHGVDRVERNGVAAVTLTSRAPMVVTPFRESSTGRGVLVDAGVVAGGFIVERVLPQAAQPGNVTPVETSVSRAEREAAHRHRGGVIWMTGLSACGKSTIAMATQRRLFAEGRQVCVLDGDNLRKGLCRDLGFTPDDRAENVRRVAEVARLFAEAGFIVLVSLISPTVAGRAAARSIIGADFHEIYIRADLETCRRRDPKQLYAGADAGTVVEFTGVSQAYEPPPAPSLVIDTATLTIEAATDQLLAYVSTSLATVREARQAG